MKSEYERTFDRLIEHPGTVFLMGGLDSGKTTFGIELARRAVKAGIKTAIVDGDVVQSTIGPPTTTGLKLCDASTDFSELGLRVADGLGFVGSLAPKGHLLPLITSTLKLVNQARAAGCRLIVIDSASLVSGIYGQTLKYFKLDLISPDYVVAFEHGGELEPLVGLAQRFCTAEMIELDVAAEVRARSVDERMQSREESFAAYFANGSSRWRVRPTVFMPTLPPEFDLAQLDELVVGMEDGAGHCVGIGVLEYDSGEDVLRMISPVSEGVRGLRLGSIRMDISGRAKGPVDLRQLFGTE